MFLEGAGASGSESSSPPEAPADSKETAAAAEEEEEASHSWRTWEMMIALSAEASTPSTRLSCRYLKRKSFLTLLRLSRSTGRSVCCMMADTASEVDSGTISLEVTVWASEKRSGADIRDSSSAMPCFSLSVNMVVMVVVVVAAAAGDIHILRCKEVEEPAGQILESAGLRAKKISLLLSVCCSGPLLRRKVTFLPSSLLRLRPVRFLG